MTADIQIQPLAPEQLQEAARVLARAFVTNPLHVAAFGAGRVDRNEAFFRGALPRMKGPRLVATDGARILGFIHWVEAPGCRSSWREKLGMLPILVRGCGPRSAWRVGSWFSAWARRDPGQPHLHLGPVAVLPEVQRQHIGRRLMERYCEALDGAGACGHLETDRPENVAFYRHFGFEITEEALVLGVLNHFMWREPEPVDAGS